MLILQSDAVTYCSVRNPDAVGGPQPGLRYRDRLFVRGRCYRRSERRSALLDVRALLEGQDQVLLPVLVDSGDELTIWLHDERVTLANGDCKGL